MKHLLIVISIGLFSHALYAQNTIERILADVEQNNTTLGAARKQVDARKIGNKTDIYLQNPEATFNYLWGSPSVIGNRKDFSISQTFDFPSAYRYKNQLSDLRNEQAELEYEKQLRAVLLETRLTCYDLIYVNALIDQRTKRLANAQSIEKSFSQRFESGDASILEHNKAQLSFLNVSQELKSLETRRTGLLMELTRLNGGQAVDFSENSYQVFEIPEGFDQWYAVAEQRNPTFAWLKKEIEASQKQSALNKALSLPKLQAGYMSESVVGEQFQGVMLGLSIPLWENKNKVKYAQANALAMESMASDTKLQFYNHLKSIHAQVIALQKNINEYRLALGAIDNSALAKKALDEGEISLIDYLVELTLYYESEDRLLELENELNKVNAELIQYQ